MSISITLLKTSSESNRVDKLYSTIATLSGTLKENTSIINPIITIEADLTKYVNCNYMYIENFNRFYFVDNITSIRNGLIQFSCRVDVLMSYRTAIRKNNAIIKKQENKWNLYLNDGTFKAYQNPNVLTKAFPSGFTTQEFVLAVAGG